MLKQGEVAIGLALTFQAVNERNDGQPLEIIFPETGSPFSLTGTAMIDGRELEPEIVEVYDFIINDFLLQHIRWDEIHLFYSYLAFIYSEQCSTGQIRCA